jgi:hypothetical protein
MIIMTNSILFTDSVPTISVTDAVSSRYLYLSFLSYQSHSHVGVSDILGQPVS